MTSAPSRRCERVLVGLGSDTYDPVCELPAGHAGACKPSPQIDDVHLLNDEQRRQVIIDSAHAAAPAFVAATWRWASRWNGSEWNELVVPSEAEIALRLAAMVAECEFDTTRSSGRLHVHRYVEDGEERIDVSLSLGSVHGEESRT